MYKSRLVACGLHEAACGYLCKGAAAAVLLFAVSLRVTQVMTQRDALPYGRASVVPGQA